MKKIKATIISANELFRKGLSHILNSTNIIECTHCDSTCDDAILFNVCNESNVILVDVQLPSMVEIELISCLVEKYSEVRIIATLPIADDFATIELINRGVRGVVTHQIGLNELKIAIQTIANKESYFSNPILKTIKNQYFNSEKKSISFTEEELKLLNEIAVANTIAESCERLTISLEEYSNTRSILFEKTNCTNNSSLAAFSFMVAGLPLAE